MNEDSGLDFGYSSRPDSTVLHTIIAIAVQPSDICEFFTAGCYSSHM